MLKQQKDRADCPERLIKAAEYIALSLAAIGASQTQCKERGIPSSILGKHTIQGLFQTVCKLGIATLKNFMPSAKNVLSLNTSS